jgi:GxxExxY protein
MEEMAKRVYETLGPGYSECVYHRAFEVLLRNSGTPYETERIVPIVFDDHTIGNLRIDLIIDGIIIIELKAIAKLTDANKTQVKNYMKLTGLTKAYLINFPQISGATLPEILTFAQPE